MKYLTLLIFIAINCNTYAQKKGVFVDSRDGKEYKWVKLGQQVWMSENLAYLPSLHSPYDEQVQAYGGMKIVETPFQFVYGYDGVNVSEAKTTSNYKDYGVLYNCASATKSCPDGWHLPSDKEWMKLEKFIGMKESEIKLMDYARGNVSDKLKSKELWSDQVKGTDIFNLSFRPAGALYMDPEYERGAKFIKIGLETYFWSSTMCDHPILVNRLAIIRSVINTQMLDFGIDNKHFGRYKGDKAFSYSVRCIQD